jgi:hypothetical protein
VFKAGTRAAQLLPHRDHRQGAGADRPEDRQADGRHDPRQGRPEGHRAWSAIEAQQLGVPATAIEAAVAARVDLVHARPSARRPRRSMARRRKLRHRSRTADRRPRTGAARRQDRRLCAGLRGDGKPPRRSSAGTCRCRPSPRSGAPAASSARASSTDRLGLRQGPGDEPLDGAGLHRDDEGRASRAAPVVVAAALGRPAGAGAVGALWPISTATAGARHGEPDPGAARLLRRAWLRA